jgi:hypothetical protein
MTKQQIEKLKALKKELIMNVMPYHKARIGEDAINCMSIETLMYYSHPLYREEFQEKLNKILETQEI